MSSQQFVKDLSRGKAAEEYVAGMIQSWGYIVNPPPEKYFPDFDLEVIAPTGVHKTVEVKFDILAAQTGRLALELEALDHSKADLLAIVTENPRTVYFSPLAAVREFAHQWHRHVRGGEFNQPMALVPRSIFIDKLHPQILTTHPL